MDGKGQLQHVELLMYLFRNQLRENKLITLKEEASLRSLSMFVVFLYAKYWLQCMSASDAPINDLLMLRDIKDYEKIDSMVARSALKALNRHLWYLSSELVCLAIFSDKVAIEEKNAMVSALSIEDPSSTRRVRVVVDSPYATADRNLHEFVSNRSLFLFKKLKLDISFLTESEWLSSSQYKLSKMVVDKLTVVNDPAERGVGTVTKFIKSGITTDEAMLQALLAVVGEH